MARECMVDSISRELELTKPKAICFRSRKLRGCGKPLAEHGHEGMTGDGANDAPAMAASIGMAMGRAGTDTAIEDGGYCLMRDDLLKVAEVIVLGNRTFG